MSTISGLDAKKLYLFPADAETFLARAGVLGGAISATVTEERNGIYELIVTSYPNVGSNYPSSGLEYFGAAPRPNMIITAKPNPQDDPQPFRISSIRMDVRGTMEISAKHISYDLNRRVTYAAKKTLQGWISHLNEVRPPFVFATDITAEGELGVEVPTPVRSLLGGAEGSLLQKFGGELRFDGFNVSLLSARSSGVWNVRYGSNMTKLDYRLSNEDAYNSYYAYWRGSDGTVVTGYGTVQAYIGDADGNSSGDTVRTAYDRVVIDVSDQFETAPTSDQVKAAGQAKLLANYKQSIQTHVVVAAVDAPGMFGQDWSELRLCDTVNIYHPIIGQLTAKIIKTKYDPLSGKYTEITIGTPRRTLPKRLAAMERRV